MRRPAARRALVVEPDEAAAAAVVAALRGAGVDAHAVADTENGLRRLAALEPQILILELEFPGRDGLWLLRRIRDEYMGSRPRIVVTTRPEAIVGRIADLGVDALILKPADPRAVITACAETGVMTERAQETELLRELVKLSILSGDLGEAFAALARRLALVFRTSECIVAATASDRQWIGCARGPVDESPDAPIWDVSRVALDAGAPVLAATAEAPVGTYLAVPIESAGGIRLGVILFCDDAPRLFSPELIDSLRALGTRLYGELAWRSVHDRIAADRDRLRESSMLDPMLGVWTRAALEQALPGEVSACQRRGEALSVAILNLRGLRHLNERYGHVAGDAGLKHVARTARTALRAQDLVARYGGDSFALVLPGTTLRDARHVVERLADAIAGTPVEHEQATFQVEVVAGLAPLLGEDDSGEAALGRAMWAMKTAKRRRESICVAEDATPDGEAALGAAEGGLEAGATLGGMYQVLHEISRGAMGVVYRAEDLGLGRPVALKTLRPDLARDRNFVERFRIEAATLAAIRHEHLVQVYAFGMDGDDVYFVMELVEGEPLEDRIEMARHDARPIALERVERIVAQIAGALDAMHHAGILHRDVKPANILLDRVRDRAVLVDVGIAKKRGTEHDPAGTPGFTAPESFTGGTEGPASDVYGLAATAYMLLTTATPFGEGALEEILDRQERQPPGRASAWRPGLPTSVDDVLLRALDPSPGRRYASASEFAGELSQALRQASPEVWMGLDGAPARASSVFDSQPSLRVEVVPPPTPDADTQVGDEHATRRAGTATPGPRDAPLTRLIPASKRATGPVSIVGADAAAIKLPSLREPDAPDVTVPHTRGVLFRSAYRVLGARQGAAWVALVSRKQPALGQALQPQNTLLSWHPTDVFVAMLREIAESGRDARAFGRELGRVATSVTFSRFFGADPTALSPGEVLLAADLFWRRYHTWGLVHVSRRGDDEAEVTIGGGPREALVCPSTAGILEQVALLSGASSAEVEHEGCEAAGADACRFLVRWSLGPRPDAT